MKKPCINERLGNDRIYATGLVSKVVWNKKRYPIKEQQQILDPFSGVPHRPWVVKGHVGQLRRTLLPLRSAALLNTLFRQAPTPLGCGSSWSQRLSASARLPAASI